MQNFFVSLAFALSLVEFSCAGTYEDPTKNNPPSSGGGSGANCDYCNITCSGQANTRCGATLVSVFA